MNHGVEIVRELRRTLAPVTCQETHLSFSGVVLELCTDGAGTSASASCEDMCMSCTASAALATGSPAIALTHCLPGLSVAYLDTSHECNAV